MKKLIGIVLCLCFGLYANARTSPIYWEEARYFSADISYAHKALKTGKFDVFALELACFPDPTMGWEMTTSIEFGKDYFSFEPISLVGSIFVFVTQLGEYEANLRLASLLLAATAGRVPIHPLDWMEIVPYWNLMKGTLIPSKFSKMQIHGDVGLSLRFFPLESVLDWYDTFFISPFAEFDFGYKKESPFKGFSFGIKTGIYF